MNKAKNKLIAIGFLSIFMIGEPLSKAQTVNLIDSDESGMDEIKAALKVEQRNYDNLASKLKAETSAAQHNQDLQESWMRWINSGIKEIGTQPEKATSSEKLLQFIRNRSEQINGVLEENKQNEKDLLSQENLDRAKLLTLSLDLGLQLILQSLAVVDYPMDVNPEDAVKNIEEFKKIKEVPKVEMKAMSGTEEEVINKFMMKQSGLGDIDEFIKSAVGFIPGKTTKQEVEKKVGEITKTVTPSDKGETWMFVLRGLKMKMTDGATGSVEFDKDGVFKNVIVTSISSGKMEKVLDSDDRKSKQEAKENEQPNIVNVNRENNVENLDLNLPKEIGILFQKGDIEKLKILLNKCLNNTNEDNFRSLRKKLYLLICISRFELDMKNNSDALIYANKADNLVRNNAVFKPADVCLKDVYLSRARIFNGNQKGAEDALSSAIKLFSEKIDIGYPITEHQSPLLAGIVTDLFAMPPRFQNIEYFKTNLSILNNSIMRLVTTPEDNLKSPGEQLFLDSYKAVLLFSEVLLASGKYNEAIKLVDDCIISSYRRQNRYNNFSKESIYYLDALQIKSLALKLSGDNKMAKKVLQEWMNNYKQRFSDVVQCSSEQQKLLFSSNQHPINFLILMDDPLAVADLLFFYKGSVIDSILTSKAIISNSNDSSLKQKLSDLNLQKSKVNSKQDLTLMEQDLANEVRKHFKEADILNVIKNQNFRQLSKILPKQSAFIDYFIYDTFGKLASNNPSYGAIVITDDGKLSLAKLGECQKIDALVDRFRKINSSFTGTEMDAEMTAVCKSLYDGLIYPLKTYIGNSTNIIISPDGNLNFIPFAAFIDPSGKNLVEKMAIHYVSSGRDLLMDFVVNSNKEMTIIANPLFSKSDLSTPEHCVFQPLPGTVREAEQIMGIMTNNSYTVTIFNGTNASKNSVFKLDCPRILHIATHGFNLCSCEGGAEGQSSRGMKIVAGSTNHLMTNNTEKPNPMFKTGLAFYGANDTFRQWDMGHTDDAEGILTAAEVPLLNLNGASLVTLSACQTGEGEVVGGEGVFGLRRGFLQSGAKNILMTLWPIADQETVDIMAELYKKIALNDDDPGSSLSEVQREWMPKMKTEKGICYAINRAAPFIIFTKGKMSSAISAQGSKAIDSSSSSQNQPASQQVPTTPGESSYVLELQDALTKADAGDAYAQAVVSIYYTMAYKAPKDTAKGLAYAMKSAAQKNPLGIYQVGALRELGSGVKKDKAQAHKLMAEAFDGLNTLNGDPYALYDLGYMALSGIGVEQSPKEAARLFKTSADLGYAPAQKMYSLLLEKGVGVPQDPEQSAKYKRDYQSQWPAQ
jgi:CHAT domain-containing protein